MPEPSAQPQWEVIGQREEIRVGPSGQLVHGVVVQFRTASGAVGTVFVPETAYTVEEVRRIVAAKAAEVEAVARLKG
jgi:hypothetical protein